MLQHNAVNFKEWWTDLGWDVVWNRNEWRIYWMREKLADDTSTLLIW